MSKSGVVDILLFLIILCLAAWLRFKNLEMMPDGFHGDEAISGIEGEHILREGYIGPYSGLAMGQPTGPLYLTALSLRLFGSTVWAVRAVSAFLGTMTVGVLYLMLRRNYEAPDVQKRAVALLGAASLATSHWHLHFSRVGFPIIAWPLCTLLAAWAALEAVKHRQARWWCLAGLLLGLGVYSYNAHILCILAFGLWFLFYLARQRDVAVSRRIGWLLVFGVSGVIATVPLLFYVLDARNGYFEHAHLVSVFSNPSSPWQELNGVGPKLLFLLGRYIGFWDHLSFRPIVDGVDASGVVPVVPILMLLIAVFGLVRGWKLKRGSLMEICLFICLLLPLGPATTLDGYNRRAFAMAPFIALLFAAGVVELYLWASYKTENKTGKEEVSSRKFSHKAALGGVVLLWGAITFQNVNDYFVKVLPSEPIKWTYGQEMAATIRYLNTLPPDAHVYFYSPRWSSKYEPRVFLARHVSIEDRSKQFGTFSFVPTPGRGKPYFVLLGDYKKQLKELSKLYAHSQVVNGPPMSNGQPAFIALHPEEQ